MCARPCHNHMLGCSVVPLFRFFVLRNTKKMTSLFKAGEVSRLAGFAKPWMLNHLEREGIFLRQNGGRGGHGTARGYSFVDLLVLRSINRMLNLGLRPARIKDVINQIKEIDGFLSSRDVVEDLVKSVGVRLFITGNKAYLLSSDKTVIDLTSKGQLSFGFMIDLKSTLGSVVDLARAYEKVRKNNWKADQLILDGLCEAAGI